MANEAEIIASNILSSAIEYKRLYDQTKNNEYKVKEQRLRRIAENVKLLLSSTSTSSVNSFNGRTGAVVLTSADVTTALGYTPPTNLNGLTDVTLSAPANGQVLTYNSTTSQWENQTPAGGGGGGDMLKSTYDVDNDGTVDSAERIEIIVRNSTGTTLTKGTVVYLSGATGNRPNAVRAQADTEATSSKTFGIVVADINNNSDGYVACNGTLHDLDTSAFADGTALWLSATTAGAYTSTIPAEPNHTVFIGYVARSHPTQGRLVILIQNGYELNELHGVLISSEANNDLLVYESSSTLWKNKSISTIFGGTPLVSVPTLAQVTTAGNTTTNAITVGGLTSTLANANVTHVGANAKGFYVRNNADSLVRAGLQFDGNTAFVELLGRYQNGATFIRQDGANGNISFLRDGSEYVRIFGATGNTAIGTTTDAGYKLDVIGSGRVKGLDNSSSTTAFLVQNTGGWDNLKVTNDGQVSIGGDGLTTFPLRVYGNSGLQIQVGNALFSYNAVRTIRFLNANNGIPLNHEIVNQVSGTDNSNYVYFRNQTIQTAGSNADWTGISIETIVNTQTSTKVTQLLIKPTYNLQATTTSASIQRGIYYNPTITTLQTAIHRAIETVTGDVIFGSTSGSVVVAATSVTNMQYGEVPKLYVNGGSYLNGNVQLGTSTIRVSGNNISWESTGITNNLPEWRADATGVKFGNYLSLPLRISVNGVENARFFSTGNVSIGTTTDAGYKLDVNGTARFVSAVTFNNSATNTIGGFVHSSSSPSNDAFYTLYLGSVRFYVRSDGYCKTTTSIVTEGVGSVDASAISQIDSTTKGFLQPRMTNAQAVAITTPATGLQVYDTTNNKNLLYNGTAWQNIATETWVSGQGYLTSTPTLAQVTTAGNTTTNTITVGGLTSNGNVNVGSNFVGNGTLQYIHFTGGSGEFRFKNGSGGGWYYTWCQNGSTGLEERMRLSSGNNLLIGTTTDAGYRLDVNGTTALRGTTDVIGGTLRIASTGTLTQPSYITSHSDGGWNFTYYTHNRGAGVHFFTSNNGNASIFSASARDGVNINVNDLTSGNPFSISGTVNASSAIARGQLINTTLVAAANNDVLVGLDINPTFTNGAFTGVSNIGLRVSGQVLFNAYGAYNTVTPTLRIENVDTNNVAIQIKGNVANYKYYWIYDSQTTEGIYKSDQARIDFYGGTNVGFAFRNNYGRLFTIVGSTGNVLIGTTTDAGYKLDVNGTIRSSGTNGFILYDGTYGAKTSMVGYVFTIQTEGANGPTVYNFKYSDNSDALYLSNTAIRGVPAYDAVMMSRSVYAPHNGAFGFVTYAGTTQYKAIQAIYTDNNTSGVAFNYKTGGTDTEAMRITSAGNVGIGTSSPTDKLHIVDNTNGNKFGRISAGGTNASAAWVAQNDQVDNVVYRVFGSAVTGTQMGISLARSASLMANLGGSGKFLVGTYSSTDFVMGTGNQERMRLVDTTGNFLIGTTSDNGNKLQVSGSIDSTGYSINNIAGYTGLLMIPGNPPGMQNVDIQGGIIVNIF